MRLFTGQAGLIFGCLIFCFSAARSQGLYPVSTEQKIINSTLIVEGKVISKRSAWNNNRSMIYTASVVEVYKIFKGSLQQNTVEIITVGGAVDGHLIQATHLLELNKNDVGVFFCRPAKIKNAPSEFSSPLEVYSSSQGFYKYDLLTKTASAPFVEYKDIDRLLYNDLRNKTGRSPEIKDSKFTLEKPAAKFQSDNSILAPVISSFSPTTVTAGTLLDPPNNVLTITGTGFGAASGDAAVLFSNADASSGSFIDVVFSSPLIVSWSSTQIKVRVPTAAGTGPIRVVDNAGNFITTSTNLNILYSVLTADFGDPYGIKQFTLGNMNSSGGYSIKYSTATGNSGVNINTSQAKETFQRALNTWKDGTGVNFIEAGTTSLQTVNPDDGENIIEYDNGGTGMPPLADGVLATCFSGITICTNDPVNNQARKTGFDIVLRNTGFSNGSTPFTLGPCPPLSEFSNVVDLETVLLHELGHALNLGHIVDPLQGSGAGTATPGKVMHFSIAYNLRRISLDYASKAGGLFMVTPHGYSYGNCITGNPEMSPVQTILEAKDECPATFPVSTMPILTTINFDLAHATSNKFGDPAYNQWKKDGTGSNVTNTAFYAFKTNETGGSLSMEVKNYTTSPVAISACTLGGTGVPVTGVKISMYKVSSCPTGGSFPVPVDYQTFKNNGALTDVSGLTANSTYLIAVDGIQNTKAVFDIVFSGSALPVKSTELNGEIVGDHNELTWSTDPSFDVSEMVLERSDDGVNYVEIHQIVSDQEQQAGQYSDADPFPGANYYRVKVQSGTGTIQYSEVVTLNRSDNGGITVNLATNSGFSQINLEIVSTSNDNFGTYGASIVNSLGQQVYAERYSVNTRRHQETINIGNLAKGIYYIKIFGKNGEKLKAAAFMKM
jgi:hypothetical protein